MYVYLDVCISPVNRRRERENLATRQESRLRAQVLVENMVNFMSTLPSQVHLQPQGDVQVHLSTGDSQAPSLVQIVGEAVGDPNQTSNFKVLQQSSQR
mmetsp:Transcript_32595/g.74969  ORF Transcript_32595/g.74969 Transcript_32595/m.74969 type:complete len:98 (+) Transcript_32595:346-639(+)